jgi:hypothetical protein
MTIDEFVGELEKTGLRVTIDGPLFFLSGPTTIGYKKGYRQAWKLAPGGPTPEQIEWIIKAWPASSDDKGKFYAHPESLNK